MTTVVIDNNLNLLIKLKAFVSLKNLERSLDGARAILVLLGQGQGEMLGFDLYGTTR